MNRKLSSKWLLPAIALGCLVAAGCKVTAEDIETWKGTVKGPGKIVAVILADKYSDDLRVRAALALVEMERSDVNGVEKLQQTLGRLDPEKRSQIIDGMVPRLEEIMRGGNRAQGANDQGPSPQQIRAKDAAFLMIAYASPATRQRLTQAVVGWYTQDFNGRSLAGNYSAEQVVRALGAPAASILVDALNAQLPEQALVKLTELIKDLGDPATKARAGARMIAIEHELEGAPMLAQLEGVARDTLHTGNDPRANDPHFVTVMATMKREALINDGALPAMKNLASDPAVASRLLEIAEAPSTDPTMTARRKRALMALEGAVGPQHLDRLLNLALTATPENPDEVRDYAFDRVGDIRSPQALPRLWPLIEDHEHNQRQRWRAGEMVLAIGGSAIVTEFFSKLPTAPDTPYAPEELIGYATRMAQMSPQPTEIMRQNLGSPHWWARVIALRYFERKGVLADVQAVQRLHDDNAPCTGPGWDAGYTVGKVAESVQAAMLERLGTPATGAAHP